MTRPKFKPGQRVWDVSALVSREGSPDIELYSTNFVHQRGSWCRYRNLETGVEWNENGSKWHPSSEAAYIAAIRRAVSRQAYRPLEERSKNFALIRMLFNDLERISPLKPRKDRRAF